MKQEKNYIGLNQESNKAEGENHFRLICSKSGFHIHEQEGGEVVQAVAWIQYLVGKIYNNQGLRKENYGGNHIANQQHVLEDKVDHSEAEQRFVFF